jgi:hypothetical protein
MVIDEVVAGMRAVLGEHLGHLRSFYRAESQIEGWFMGEMIVLLDGMKRAVTGGV